jgi:outer membrane protein assembly factor BamD
VLNPTSLRCPAWLGAPVLVALSACSHASVPTAAAAHRLQPLSADAAEAPRAAPSGEPAPDTLYAQGVESLYSGQYPEAQKSFEAIKVQHPYSRFAALAELRLADAHMRRGQYIEAAEAFQSFLKFHPSHPQADYAALQVAEAYYAMIPRDWGFLPPSAEKEQTATRSAIAAYERFLGRDAGGGPEAADGKKARAHLAECRRRLADHEMYVATFYYQRDQYQAAASRAEVILNLYENLGLDAEALWIAGSARAKLGEASLACLHLQRLVEKHPQSPQVLAAKSLLKSLQMADAAASPS